MSLRNRTDDWVMASIVIGVIAILVVGLSGWDPSVPESSQTRLLTVKLARAQISLSGNLLELCQSIDPAKAPSPALEHLAIEDKKLCVEQAISAHKDGEILLHEATR